jgi:MFS family permease
VTQTVGTNSDAAAKPPTAPPVALEYQTPPAEKTWTVGTLVYTTSTLVAVFAWLLLGVAGMGLRDRAYPTAVTLILKQDFSASNTAIAFFMTFMAQGLAMVLGPVVAFRSDRLRSRWGRRIPFIAVATPLVVLAMVGVALSPAIHAGRGGGGIVVFGILWTLFLIGVVSVNTIFPALMNDVVPRPVIGRFMALNRQMSLICGVSYNYLIIGHVEAHFAAIFIAMAIWCGVTTLGMVLMVKEGNYPPPDDAAAIDDFRANGFLGSIATYFRECFRSPHYLWIFSALALGGLALGPVNWFAVLYAKKIGLPVATYGKIIGTNHICGFLLAYPIGVLVDRLNPLRMSIVTMAAYAAVMLLGGLCIVGPWTFGAAVFLHAVISGTYLTASAALPMVLMPRAKFAQFLSASVVLTSAASMIASLLVGQLLDRTGDNYRLTYLIGFAMAAANLVVMFVVYRRYMAMGGPGGYVAPEPGAATSPVQRGFPLAD